MKKEQIRPLFEQFENACYNYQGIECSVHDLQEIPGYSERDKFRTGTPSKKQPENDQPMV